MFRLIIQCIALCNLCNQAFAWIPQNMTFISQINFHNANHLIEHMMQDKQKIQAKLTDERNKIYTISEKQIFTPQQKKFLTKAISHRIDLMESRLAKMPDNRESLFIAGGLEKKLNKKNSIGANFTLQKNSNLNNDKIVSIGNEVFFKHLCYSKKNKHIFLIPKIIAHYNGLIESEIRLQGLISKKFKKYTRFSDLQFAARTGFLGPQYLIDATYGVRLKNNLMFIIQSFYYRNLEIKNLYKETIRNQISCAYEISDPKIFLQIGYFNHRSIALHTPISSGIFFTFQNSF